MAQIFDTPLFSSDQSIDRVLQAGLPVLLVFLNGTPPAALDQAMKTLAKQEAGKLLVVQLPLKDSPETARRFHVSAPPAVVAVMNGQAQSQAENIYSDDLEKHARFLLGKGPKPEPQRAAAAAQGSYATQGAGVGAASQPGAGRQPYGYGNSPGAGPAPAQAGASPAGYPVVVTDSSFDQEVMRSPVPVVVDFWAPWCGPCRMVAPTLDKLAAEWNGSVKIAKVNVDENPLIAGRFGITGIPTMMVFSSGKLVDRWAGALPEPALRSRLGNSIK